MNLRASKRFNIHERANVSVFAEFFNLFNRANFCNSYEEDASLIGASTDAFIPREPSALVPATG